MKLDDDFEDEQEHQEDCAGWVDALISAAIILLVLVILAVVGLLAGCATDTGDPARDRAGRVTNVALTHLASDVMTIGLNALAGQAKSGFTQDWGYATVQAGYAITPEVLSSGNLRDYLDAWNPAAPEVNQQIAEAVSKVPVPSDPKQLAAVTSQVAVTIGDSLLAAAQANAGGSAQ